MLASYTGTEQAAKIQFPILEEGVHLDQQTQLARMAEDRRIFNDAKYWNNVSSPDVVCSLVPRSSVACQCVTHLATQSKSFSQHVLEQPRGEREKDKPAARAIVLRLSSHLLDPLKGFKFGRQSYRCDIVFAGNMSVKRDPRISLEHFSIYLDEATGAPVLQDHSAYGTIVDGEHLKPCDSDNGPLSKSAEERSRRMTLREGSVIEINLSPLQTVLSFTVRFPLRRTEEDEEFYKSNLRAYRKRLAALVAEKEDFETVVASKVWLCNWIEILILVLY